MGKIWEALQHAQAERIQRDTLVQELSGQAVGEMGSSGLWPVPQLVIDQIDQAAGRCDHDLRRVRRVGIRDFYSRLIGLYPWQCTECGSRSYRFRRR